MKKTIDELKNLIKLSVKIDNSVDTNSSIEPDKLKNLLLNKRLLDLIEVITSNVSIHDNLLADRDTQEGQYTALIDENE